MLSHARIAISLVVVAATLAAGALMYALDQEKRTRRAVAMTGGIRSTLCKLSRDMDVRLAMKSPVRASRAGTRRCHSRASPNDSTSEARSPTLRATLLAGSLIPSSSIQKLQCQ